MLRCQVPLWHHWKMVSRSIRPCIGCGRPTERVNRRNRRWQCIDCACQAIDRNARSIAAKSGQGYRKWKAGNVVWALRLASGKLDPPIPIPVTVTIPRPDWAKVEGSPPGDPDPKE